MDISRFPFRRLGVEDAASIYALEKVCFSVPWSLRQCEASLGQSTFAAFGIFCQPDLAGYISIYHLLPEMEILNLGVVPDFRRKGIGRFLLNRILQVGGKMGMQKVFLEVRESNEPAIALYRGAGFVCSGIRKKYYPDNGEDALIMVRQDL